MTLEILAKRVPVYKNDKATSPFGEVPVWTPVCLAIVLPSGIGRWRVVGGFYDGCIVYVEKDEQDIFMTPSLQGSSGMVNPYV